MKKTFTDTVCLYPSDSEEKSVSNFLYGLVEFVQVLRRHGIRSSVAETRDAVDALTCVDLLDRDQVKVALSATLVKDHYDWKTFDQAFDAFFALPETRMPQLALGGECAGQEDKPAKASKGDDRDWGEELLELNRLAVEKNEGQSIKPGWTKREFKKKFIERINRMQDISSSGPAAPIAKKVDSTLDIWHAQVKQKLEQSGVVPGVNTSHTVVAERDDVAPVALGCGSKRGDDTILYEDMKKIDEQDLPRVTLLIKKLSRRLATRISRRYLKRHRHGRLDIRRTVRKNINNGGALMNLRFHSRKEQKPRLILICDVSGSMAHYAVFVIQFIYGLSSVVKGIESFVFSEELERVTPYFKKVKSFARTMSSLVEKSEQWGMGTNMHVSLGSFLARYSRLLSPAVFVIILSDAQTIKAYEAAGDLKEIRGRVRDIIWLNTMSRKEWKQSQSIPEFQKYCSMFECSTLDQLNKVLGGQMLTV